MAPPHNTNITHTQDYNQKIDFNLNSTVNDDEDQ